MIHKVIDPRDVDIGGIIVRRSLPVIGLKAIGPWVFFDHMGPADIDKGRGLNVIAHPHINLATVTYLFDGEIVHRDSLGTVQTISPEAINLMIAGSGIVHSERTPDSLRGTGHHAHGLQLWLALPEEFEEIEPSFHHYPAKSLPSLEIDGGTIRVMIGEAYGVVSPVRTLSKMIYAEARMEAGGKFEISGDLGEVGIYVVSGSVRLGKEIIESPKLAFLGQNNETSLCAETKSHLVIVGGEPLGKRYMWWNFVSSRRERIERAKRDWRNDSIGSVPGETERAGLPESDSFTSVAE